MSSANNKFVSAPGESPTAESLPATAPAIEFVTENGFSILRPWERDREPPPRGGKYHFLVRDPQNFEREIAVEIADKLVLQIELQTGGRIQLCSTFWICCAERRLANYLWEENGFPGGDRLCIDQLDPVDLMSAIHWRHT